MTDLSVRGRAKAPAKTCWIPLGLLTTRVLHVDDYAEVIAWTDKAVQIRFSMMGGVEKTAWVWANAVDRF